MGKYVFILALLLIILILFIYTKINQKKSYKSFLLNFDKKKIKINKNYTLAQLKKACSPSEDFYIDDITWNDLSMDDIFKKINYCYSAGGSEYLYNILHNIDLSGKKVEELGELIELLDEDNDFSRQLAYVLKDIGNCGNYSISLLLKELSLTNKSSNLFHYMILSLYLGGIFVSLYSSIPGLFIILLAIILSVMSYFSSIAKIDSSMALLSYVLRLKNSSEKINQFDKNPNQNDRDSLSFSKNIPLSNIGKFILPSRKYTGSGNPIDMIMDYIRMLFHVDIIYFNKVIKKISKCSYDIEKLLNTINKYDCALSVSIFRAQNAGRWCVPTFVDDITIKAENLYHPLIDNPVPCNIALNRSVLLTGSNASGKSTFMKEVAISAICAQTINTAFASSYNASIYKIVSSMSLKDNIIKGESFYVSEIKAVKRILDTNGKVICFIDELLKGTNTKERIAAGSEILLSLAESGKMVFAATHDFELNDICKEKYDLYHLEEANTDDDISFSYKLIKGPTDSKCAIKLMEYIGFSNDIVENALKRIKD